VASRSRKQAGHEGATESTAPGSPRDRDVITPDWAHLDKNSPSRCVPGDDSDRSASPDDSDDAPAPRMKGPAIDRHR
jgi:hypothetical protein